MYSTRGIREQSNKNKYIYISNCVNFSILVFSRPAMQQNLGLVGGS